MNKADKIRAYVSKHPNAKPKEVAKATKSSYGYAYKIMREEEEKLVLKEVVRQHVEELTSTLRPSRTPLQQCARNIKAWWKRLVNKFIRVAGLYEK